MNFVKSRYNIESAYVKSASIESFYLEGTYLCITCTESAFIHIIGSKNAYIRDSSTMKYLEIHL